MVLSGAAARADQASQCVRCGKDCFTLLSGRRIHRECNRQRIEEQRTSASHRKRASSDGAVARSSPPAAVAAAAAAAAAFLPPLQSPPPAPSPLDMARASSSPPLSEDVEHAHASDAAVAAAALPLPLAAAAAPSLDGEPLLSLAHDLRLMWRLYGFVLVRASALSAQLAWRIMQLRPASTIEIAGQVRQTDLAAHPDFQPGGELFTLWEQILHAAAQSVGVDTTALHVVAPKQLMAQTDKGQQSVHWSVPAA